MRLTRDLASLRVTAALGRPAQDELEAAVVLESWGTPQSLALAVSSPGLLSPPPGRLDQWTKKAEESTSTRFETIGLLVGLLAAVAWTGPLVARLGLPDTLNSWRFALPVSLAVQWLLRARYLAPGEKLGLLRDEPLAPYLAVLVAVATWFGVHEDPSVGAGLALTVVWIGGLILARRGWIPLYVLLLAAGTAMFKLHFSVATDVQAESEAVLAASAIAVITGGRGKHHPASLRSSLPFSLVGLGVGLMIVVFDLPHKASGLRLLTVAMVPGMVASLAWFWRFTSFWKKLEEGLTGSNIRDAKHEAVSRMARRVDLSALGCFLAVSSVLSLIAMEVLRFAGMASGDPLLIFVDLGLVGLGSSVLATLAAFEGPLPACLVVTSALAVGTGVHLANVPWLSPYAGLITPAVAALAGLALLSHEHREPDRMLAQMR